MRMRVLFLSLGLSALLQASTTYACSSCGSGGADPLVLFPNESSKAYLGLSLQGDFQDIDSKGDKKPNYGPQQKQSLDLAIAQRLTPRIFSSLVVKETRNVYENQSQSGLGDISLNVRANALQQNIADPWIPQIQWIASHRFATGRSIYRQNAEHAMDVFGAGYAESYLGADLWYGMSSILFGGSLLLGFPQATDTEEGIIKLGRLTRWIGTVGFLPFTEIKLIGGIIREQRQVSRLDGQQQDQSDKLSHDLFLTLETLYASGNNFRVNLSRRAAFGENKNAVEASTIVVAYMKSLSLPF